MPELFEGQAINETLRASVRASEGRPITELSELKATLERIVRDTKIVDLHTHLYAPAFKDLLLCGPDELLTYHYLVAETLRWLELPYQDFWRLAKAEQADLIWRTLFIEHSPVSEACRGVLTVFSRLGLDLAQRDLGACRAWFTGLSRERYMDLVFKTAGVESVVMTNDPFDEQERPVWLAGAATDPRFKAALRLDPLLNDWKHACGCLANWGYGVMPDFSGDTLAEVRRFLGEWAQCIDALYLAVSLPPDFNFPEDSERGRLIEEAVLPVCRDLNLPLALMIGVRRGVNPKLGLAADGVGRSRIEAVERLCAANVRNKFMVTTLAREDQHSLCVSGRKFRNLLIFGCWWFLNNPSLIEEMTRMRLEMLGLSFCPQHSDARVLDQLIYKWEHSRQAVGKVLLEKYAELLANGWIVREEEICRDVRDLFGDNFQRFVTCSFA